MNRNEKALLEKQLWVVDARPQRLVALALAAVFVGGIIIGSVLFTHDARMSRATSADVTGSIPPQKRLPASDS
jgi:hypothetical protein